MPRNNFASAVIFLAAALFVPTLSSAQTELFGPFASEAEYDATRRAHSTTLAFDEVIGLVESVHIETSDQVSDGCWTNAAAVEARLRAALERSSIAVFTEEFAISMPYAPSLNLTVLGYRTDSGVCAASASMSLVFYSQFEFGSLTQVGSFFHLPALAENWSRDAVLTSSSTLNSQLLAMVDEWSDVLIADVLAAKRTENVQKFFAEWPSTEPVMKTSTNPSRVTAELLESVLSCKARFSPQSVLVQLQQDGLIESLPFQQGDGIPSFHPLGMLTAFGLPVLSVQGWDYDGSLFSRGPGTAPPVHLAIVVAAPEAEVMRILERRNLATETRDGAALYTVVEDSESTKLVCSIG